MVRGAENICSLPAVGINKATRMLQYMVAQSANLYNWLNIVAKENIDGQNYKDLANFEIVPSKLYWSS